MKIRALNEIYNGSFSNKVEKLVFLRNKNSAHHMEQELNTTQKELRTNNTSSIELKPLLIRHKRYNS